jgi:hypothetical protein
MTHRLHVQVSGAVDRTLDDLTTAGEIASSKRTSGRLRAAIVGACLPPGILLKVPQESRPGKFCQTVSGKLSVQATHDRRPAFAQDSGG